MQNNTANLNIMIKAAGKLLNHLLEILTKSKSFRLYQKKQVTSYQKLI